MIIPNTMLVVFIVVGNVQSSKATSQHAILWCTVHRDEYHSTWRRIVSVRKCGNADDAVRCQGLSLRFNAEDPKNFEKRVETCRARKAWRCDCERMGPPNTCCTIPHLAVCVCRRTIRNTISVNMSRFGNFQVSLDNEKWTGHVNPYMSNRLWKEQTFIYCCSWLGAVIFWNAISISFLDPVHFVWRFSHTPKQQGT